MAVESEAAENLCRKDGSKEEEEEEEFWLFGYGSLIWKPPPHFDLRVPGYIKGYVRRFWQASEDHRGTVAKPGRVVTLIERSFWETLQDDDDSESTSELVWGAAYRIPLVHKDEVKTYLDIREINGYTVEHVDFYPYPAVLMKTHVKAPEQHQSIKTLLYIGLPTNPNFLGVQHPSDVAEVIAKSKGPSGENAEYLFMLEEALDNLGLGSRDDHINKLSSMVRQILGEQRGQNEQFWLGTV